MKKILFILLLAIFIFKLSAQESLSLNWDIENIFDEIPEQDFDEPADTDTDTDTVLQMINRRSFTFEASFNFSAGIFPGWRDPLWFDIKDNYFTWNPGVKMASVFSLNAQISQSFRVLSVFNLVFPDTRGSGNNLRFYLGDFFFDYNMLDTVFFRGGKYNMKWGISPNFEFTNLLTRVPNETDFNNDAYMIKMDIPVGVGGFQLLALTRADIFSVDSLTIDKIGFGGKYNLALRNFDMDTGVFYQNGMPLRYFISLKTTLGNTEVYTEGLIAYYPEAFFFSGAFNIGFVHEFFDNKLLINGEFFFNNEGDSFIYSPETDFLEAKTSSFIDGFNMAINLRYRFGGSWNTRFMLQVLYAGLENSAQVIPAFSFSPFPHIDIYLGFPMSLGNKDGYYYDHTLLDNSKGDHLRFGLIFLVSLSGTLRYTVYP